MNTFQLRLVKKTHLQSDIWRFDFDRPDDLKFEAGQYLQYILPHEQVDERGEKHWFTIASAPYESVVSIVTRLVQKRSSFKFALDSLRLGDTIEAHGPEGDFILVEGAPAVLIAGGIGVTPYHAQIAQALHNSSKLEAHLLYGVKTRDDLVFDELFREASRVGLIYEPVVGTEITDKQILAAAQDVRRTHIYVSGPEAMVEAFRPRLEKLGFAAEHIHQDWFPGYAEHF